LRKAIIPTSKPKPTAQQQNEKNGMERFQSAEILRKQQMKTISRQEHLEQIFPDTEAGRQIAEVCANLNFGGSPGPEGSRLNELLDKLEDNPEHAFSNIRLGLQSLPIEFERERQFLIQFSSQLEVKDAERIDLLREQIHLPAANQQADSEGVSAYTPVVAFQALSRITDDSGTIHSALISSFPKHTHSPTTLKLLLAEYHSRFPEASAALEKKYRQFLKTELQ